MTARLRLWFIREIVAAIERERGSGAVPRLKAKLPAHLQPSVDVGRLHAAGPMDSVDLDDGDEILLAIEAALGDGSDRLLASAAQEVLTKSLAESGGIPEGETVVGTIVRLRSAVERPFFDVTLHYEASRMPDGFALTIGIAGRPRSARVLCAIGTGAIWAAERAHGQARSVPTSQVFGDRARLIVKQLEADEPESTSVRPPSVSRPRLARRPSAAFEVDRILGSIGSTPKVPESVPAPRRTQSRPDNAVAPAPSKRSPSQPDSEDETPPDTPDASKE